MYIYETGRMGREQIKAFVARFATEIGTDCEVSPLDKGEFYAVCHELETKAEVATCRRIEQQLSETDLQVIDTIRDYNRVIDQNGDEVDGYDVWICSLCGGELDGHPDCDDCDCREQG